MNHFLVHIGVWLLYTIRNQVLVILFMELVFFLEVIGIHGYQRIIESDVVLRTVNVMEYLYHHIEKVVFVSF